MLSRLKNSFLGNLFIGVVALLVWSLGWLFAYTGPIDQTRLQYSTYLLDDQGDLLHVLLAQDDRLRIKTSKEDVDGHYLRLLMAYEDQRYWWHAGVDWLAMLRAVGQLINNGYIVSGASTLTMQTVRLLEPRSRTLWSKLDQMRKALELERTHGKEEILAIYLTLAPFGGNVEGVNAASLTWFNKWPKDLTPAEAALLVALPQSPERRRPDRNPQKALTARNAVLNRGLDKQVIDQEYLAIAALSPVPIVRKNLASNAPHLAWQRALNETDIAETTINSDLQVRLTELAKNTQLAPGLNMSIIVAESQTGQIKAYIGSQDYYDFSNFGAIDYSQAIRSPGSTLKPFIYGLAQANGDIHFNTIINDTVTDIRGYQPKNLSKTHYGEVSIGEALQRSLNIPAVKVIHRYGPEKFTGKLASAGIQLQNAHGLPIALGGAGLALQNLTSLYTALGNNGKVTKTKTQVIPSKPVQLLPVSTVNQLNWILSHNQGQRGRLHGTHRQQALAYKTGTGPGGSDAWSIGTNGRYVIGIWVGTPSGEPRGGNTGMNTAVPIMNVVADQLTRKNDLITRTLGKAPIALRSFDRESNGLQVIYPVDGSVLNFKEQGVRIPFEVKKAKYPVWITINSNRIVKMSRQNSSLILYQRGGYGLAIVDSAHQSANLEIYIE